MVSSSMSAGLQLGLSWEVDFESELPNLVGLETCILDIVDSLCKGFPILLSGANCPSRNMETQSSIR